MDIRQTIAPKMINLFGGSRAGKSSTTKMLCDNENAIYRVGNNQFWMGVYKNCTTGCILRV